MVAVELSLSKKLCDEEFGYRTFIVGGHSVKTTIKEEQYG